MHSVGWQELVDLSDYEAEVVQVAREFLAQLEPWEIARLPLECQPRKLLTAADISDYAFDLVGYARDHDSSTPLLVRLSTFFSHASIRLSQLALGKANDDDGGELQESA